MNPQVENILPPHLRKLVQAIPSHLRMKIEEIRVRLGRPLEILTADHVRYLLPNGTLSRYHEAAYCPNATDCEKLLSLVSNHSLYAMEEELKRGYVTIQGGHRVGLVGRAVVEQGEIKHLKTISGFNIRIAREMIGIARKMVPLIADENGKCHNTLIISPPQCGKTTLLRDIARSFSHGIEGLTHSAKVGIVDERSEIAGCVNGVPQHDVGPRTDVLDACPKAEGMMMMIRSMSPEILIVDEIGRPEDVTAIDEAVHAGVQLVTTVHGRDMKEISKRPTLSLILQRSIFSRFIILSKRRGTGTVEGVFNADWERVLAKRVHAM